MYAFISNEYRTIIKTQRKLEFLLSVYTYAKFVKVKTEQEAREFFISQEREYIKTKVSLKGTNYTHGFLKVEYYIADCNLYYNIYTDKLGLVRLSNTPKEALVTTGSDFIKMKISNVELDSDSIGHHCLAINRILRTLGQTTNVQISLPDISVYLALTKYTGKNYIIKQAQATIKGRPGEVAYKFKTGGY